MTPTPGPARPVRSAARSPVPSTFFANLPRCLVGMEAATERQTEVVDDAVEPRCPSRRWSQCPFRKALGEDLLPAQNCIAAEAASDHGELNDTARKRKVSDAAPVMAVNAPRNGPARRTKTKSARRADRENSFVLLIKRTFHNKPSRHQTGAAKCLLHGVDSPPMGTPRESQTASKVSQSQI